VVIELSKYEFKTLREDQEYVLYRRRSDGELPTILAVGPVSEYPVPGSLERLEHEYSVRDQLDSDWAASPLALVHHEGRAMLVLEDPGGEPLDRLIGQRLELRRFLRLGIGVSAALDKLHQRGLIHKDIKPANILFDSATGNAWLTGFGIASPLARERQAPSAPEVIAGTLAYMAPEQSGRMNRSIDSDLYSLGVTLYQILTGVLPFSAADPMEWVHCHIARQPVSPEERAKNVPGPISAIIMKLLAKTAEERYQTASGLEHSNSDGSCVAYVHLGWFLGPRFGDYQAAFRFAKLGLDLVEKRGLERFRTRVSQCFAYFINPWSRHFRTGLELLRRSFSTAQEAGDLKYAVYSCDRLVTVLLAAGDPLGNVQREAEHGLEFVRKAKFGYIADIIVGQLGFIRTLRGLTPSFSSFNDAEFDEADFEQHLEIIPDLVFATCWYWIRKLQADITQATICPRSRRPRRLSRYCRCHRDILSQRNGFTITPSRGQHVTRWLPPKSGSGIWMHWEPIANSSMFGQRTAPRISETARRWLAPSSPASKAGSLAPSASMKRPYDQRARTASLHRACRSQSRPAHPAPGRRAANRGGGHDRPRQGRGHSSAGGRDAFRTSRIRISLRDPDAGERDSG
jgi:Protein kinase domain